MPSKISAKTGATAGAGTISGVSLAPLIAWILGQFGIDMPPEVAAVAGGLIAAAAATVIAWVVPAKSGKYVDTEPWVYEPAGEDVAAVEDVDWSDGELGGMAAYASDQTPEIEGV